MKAVASSVRLEFRISDFGSRIIRNPQSAIRNSKGVTLTEMLVVVAIIIILTSLSVAAYTKMQSNQRVGNAADRVMTLLQQARSLAINQNAIVHIRIGNAWNTAVPPSGAPGDQYLSIQRFPKTSDAQKVASTTDVEPETAAHAWSSWPPVRDVMTGALVIDDTALAKKADGNPYDNYRQDICLFDRFICVGQQGPKGSTAAPTAVLSFYPDGSASAPMTIFVSDDMSFVEHQPAPAVYQTVNDTRWDAFNQKTGTPAARKWLRISMVDVYQGGLIKLRTRDPNAP